MVQSGQVYRESKQKETRKRKTYSTGYSLVVTDPTTNPAITGLTMGERTGSRIFLYLWPYVVVEVGWLIICGSQLTR